MKCDIVWASVEEPAVEHLHGKYTDSGGHQFSSHVIGMRTGQPVSLHYAITCDAVWHVRHLVAEILTTGQRIEVFSDGKGNWTQSNGEALDHLAGCIDVDIIATPFTNTLPINRLDLQPGESEEIDTVYVTIPMLEILRRRQRYTRLDQGSSFRYDSLDSGKLVFSAEIEVDSNGLVLDYPGLFRRIYPARTAIH